MGASTCWSVGKGIRKKKEREFKFKSRKKKEKKKIRTKKKAENNAMARNLHVFQVREQIMKTRTDKAAPAMSAEAEHG